MLFLIFCFTCVECKSQIRIQNGGYENVVIALNEDIPEANCLTIISELNVSYIISCLTMDLMLDDAVVSL